MVKYLDFFAFLCIVFISTAHTMPNSCHIFTHFPPTVFHVFFRPLLEYPQIFYKDLPLFCIYIFQTMLHSFYPFLLLYLYICHTTPRIPPKGLTQRTPIISSTTFLYFCVVLLCLYFLFFVSVYFCQTLLEYLEGPHTRHNPFPCQQELLYTF